MPTAYTQRSLLQPLLDRGIAMATLAAFDVEARPCRDVDEAADTWFDSARAFYPIHAADGHVAGTRSRRLASVGLKNRWHEHEEDAARWLYGAWTIKAGEPCLLVEGDPDMWLMHSLAIPAATSTSPMAYPSSEMVGQFKAAAPSRVYVVYDHDDAGAQGSVRMTRALRDAGLAAESVALPKWLPPKGDVTDMYHGVERDVRRFLYELTRCRLRSIPAPEPPRPLRRVSACASGDSVWERFNSQHDIVSIAQRLAPVKCAGRKATTRCPFHDDHTPSLTLYIDDGKYYCFTCGAWGNTYDLAKKAGVA